MFLLVSGRHAGAHLDGHQHSVSIQISIKLGKKILCISCTLKNCCFLNLGESLSIFTFFLFQDSGLNLMNSFDFYFNQFWKVWQWKLAIGTAVGKRPRAGCTLRMQGTWGSEVLGILIDIDIFLIVQKWCLTSVSHASHALVNLAFLVP